MKKKQTRWMILTLALVAIFMLGCGASGGEETVIPTEQTVAQTFRSRTQASRLQRMKRAR